MRRRSFLTAGIAALCASSSVDAQQSAPTRRVGYLTGASLSGRAANLAAFRHRLGELGYAEGSNLVLDLRAASGRFDRLPSLARELIALTPDVLFVTTTPATLAAKAATTRIPVVFALVADPLGAGVVDSLARPGGNITGVTHIVAELAGKRLELLKELVPAASRVAVLINPDDPNAPLQMRHAEAAARSLGIELNPLLNIRASGDAEKAISAAAGAGANAALRMVDPTLSPLRIETVAAAAKYRLPVIYSFREDVTAGGLLSYGAQLTGQYAQAATLVAKILRGARPADLPVEQATRFELVVNLKAAKALGLSVPPSLLARADEVIE